MKQLDRLLLFQGNRCFFCDQPIPEGEASVEHLIASAHGGGNGDENCVACCKSLNSAFGNCTYKEKLRAILSHRGQFTCPRPAGLAAVSDSPVTPPAKPANERLAIVLADLQRRGAARPRKVATLKNTIAAAFQKQISEQEIAALLSQLRDAGYVIFKDQNVSYNLPAKDV